VTCKFCHFDFADSDLPPIRCSEHDSPVCPKCFSCQAVAPMFPFLAALWRDAS
jgi:hypothetical protein